MESPTKLLHKWSLLLLLKLYSTKEKNVFEDSFSPYQKRNSVCTRSKMILHL